MNFARYLITRALGVFGHHEQAQTSEAARPLLNNWLVTSCQNLFPCNFPCGLLFSGVVGVILTH